MAHTNDNHEQTTNIKKAALTYGDNSQAIYIKNYKSIEVNLGLSLAVLKILDKVNATSLVPQLFRILVEAFGKEEKLTSEILKDSLDKATAMVGVTSNEDFNHAKEMLQADLISHEKEIADFISNKARIFASESESTTTAITLEQVIEYLRNYLLAYVRRSDDQDLYTPLEGYYDTITFDPQRFKLLEEVIIPFLQNPEQETLLILGEAGSGKTMFAEYLMQYLWQSAFACNPSIPVKDNTTQTGLTEKAFIPNQQMIPIYIRLSSPDIKNLQETLIEEALMSYGLTENEVRLLLSNTDYPFCFIFDGTDELIRKDNNFEKFYLTNKIHQRFPTSHCLFTGRISGFLAPNYEELFEPIDDHGRRLTTRRAKTIMLASFNEMAKKEYISKFIKERPVAIQLGYTDFKTVYERIEAISHLNDIVGRPILLMMTMKVLPYLEAFYKQEKEFYSFEIVYSDLFHIYTHDLYRRAADKIRERNNNLTHIGKNSIYDCILLYSIRLAQAMNNPKNKSPILQISEDEIFSDEDAFALDASPHSPKTVRWMMGLKKFFCREYDAAIFKKEEDYKAFKFGREGCELLRYRGIPGHFIYSFIHNDFLDYLATFTPQRIGGRRKQIKEFMDSYKITDKNGEKQESLETPHIVSEPTPKNFRTSQSFFPSTETPRRQEQEIKYKEKNFLKSQAEETFFLGYLPGENEPICFREEKVLGDGNCGFTTLGPTREAVYDTLIAIKDDVTARECLAEEIREVLMTKELSTETSTRLLELLYMQQDKENRELSRIRAQYADLPYFDKDTLDNTIRWLTDNSALEEAEALRQMNLKTFRAEDELLRYCKSLEIFEVYLRALKSNEHFWLGFKSALLYAKIKGITLYIWTKSEIDEKILILQDHVIGQSGQLIHMLSTGRYTHFNLLVEEVELNDEVDSAFKIKKNRDKVAVL